MPGFDGTGPAGRGPMTGGGRGFCSPWGISATYGAFPRIGYPYYGWPRASYPFYRAPAGVPTMSREQELDSLKNQAQGLRQQLEQIEARIQQLGSKS